MESGTSLIISTEEAISRISRILVKNSVFDTHECLKITFVLVYSRPKTYLLMIKCAFLQWQQVLTESREVLYTNNASSVSSKKLQTQSFHEFRSVPEVCFFHLMPPFFKYCLYMFKKLWNLSVMFQRGNPPPEVLHKNRKMNF